jgi:hypothetical protein
LTLDLFLGRWNASGAAGELWTCILPHAGSVHDFVPQSTSDANFSYQLATYDPSDTTTTYIPVPFPDDTIVSITLLDASQQPLIGPITIQRNQRMMISPDNIGALQQLNQDPNEKWPLPPPPPPSPPAPYAKQFNDGLRQAYESPQMTDQQLEQHLQTLFWGGTQRRFTDQLMSQYNDAGFMLIESGPPIVTNLHSMLGLMVRLGTRDDLPSLNSVAAIKLELGSASGATQQAIVATDVWIASFFSKLGGNVNIAPDSVQWVTDRGKRRWVRRSRIPFAAATGIASGLYRRRAEDATGAETSLSLAKLARLTLTGSAPATPATPVTVTLYSTVSVHLAPYRAAPMNGTNVLYRMIPIGPAAAARLAALALDAIAAGTLTATGRDGSATTAFEWVGAYRFPWDGTDAPGAMPTLLWRGPAIQGGGSPGLLGGLALLQCGPGLGGAAVTLDLPVDTTPRSTNATIQRWVWNRPSPPPTDVGFDAFAATTSIPGDAAFTAEFDGDYDFELAQSISELEDSVTVMFSGFAMPVPASYGPQDAADEDRVNYNALNVLVDQVPINPYSELYPAQQPQPPDHSATYAFELRYHLPVLAPSDGDTTTTLPTFFGALYDRLGGARAIGGTIEHTYGVELALPPGTPHKLWADFPVQSAADVVSPSTNPSQDPPHFLTATYQRASLDGSEHIILQFAPSLLGSPASRDPHQMAAWRAVAELAHAKSIAIEVQCRQFNLDQALASGGSTPAAGMTSTVVAPDDAALLDSTLRAAAAAWLATPPHIIEPIDIMLKRSAPWLWQQYDAIALVLVINRDDTPVSGVVPPADGWQDIMFDASVPPTNPPVPTDLLPASQAWQRPLKASCRPLATPPDISQAPLSSALRLLLNGDAASGGDGLAWISPSDGIIEPTGTPPVTPPVAPGALSVSFCPFGFVPVCTSTPLGDLADRRLRALCRLLQAVLTLQLPGFTDADLAQVIRPVLGQLQAWSTGTGAIAQIVSKILALATAMPHVGVSSRVPASVQDAASAINAALADPQSGLATWLCQQLWNDLSLFAESKGFLALVMAGAQPAPTDFYDLSLDVAIPDTGATDTLTASWPDLLSMDDTATKRLVALWMLNEPRYADWFWITQAIVHRFDDFAARIAYPARGEARPAYPIPTTYTAPIGPITPGSGFARFQSIFLAARDPLQTPVHQFTGIIDAFQPSQLAIPATNTTFSFAALKTGSLETPQPGTAGGVAQLVAASTLIPRDGMPFDAFILSALYLITPGEEDAGAPIDGFTNDTFVLPIMTTPVAPGPAVPPWPNTDVSTLFGALDKSTDGTSVAGSGTGIPSVLTDAALLTTAAMFLPIDQGAPPPIGQPVATIQPGPPVGLTVTPGTSGDPSTYAEAFLFQVTGMPGAASSGFALLINRRASVWYQQALGIVQTRNEATASQPAQDFAPAFGETAAASAAQLFQPILLLDAAALQQAMAGGATNVPPLPIPRSTNTLEALLLQLVAAGLLDKNGQQWNTQDLSVTVHHEQQATLPGQFPAPFQLQPQSIPVPRATSRFPLLPFRAAAGSSDWTKTIALFPTPYQQFSVDFQWSSPTNLQFFRLNNVRIQVTG